METRDLTSLLDQFTNMPVLVIGDSMLDAYMWGDIHRMSPEAPVPIVDITRRENRLGGAANVALNIKSLGGKPILCSVIGKDNYGEILLSEMDRNALETSGIIRIPHRKTTVKTRIIAGEKHVVRVDEETTDDLDKNTVVINHIIDQIIAYRPRVIIFEDYNKGMLTDSLITEITMYAREYKIPVVVDPKVKNFLSYRKATLFKPNLREISAGLGRTVDPSNLNTLKSDMDELRTLLEGADILLTMSEHGMAHWDGKNLIHYPAEPRKIVDVSGAGDTSVATAAMALAAHANAEWVTRLANTAGGLVCEYPGVVPIDKDMLRVECSKRIKPTA